MISLIVTVLNEKNNLADWLDSILGQTVLPNEIVVVDGGSQDGTWPMLLQKSQENSLLKVWQQVGNISTGRNLAISKAVGEIIVVTDAGCRYDTDWLKKIVQPILLGNNRCVATGFGPWLKADDGLLIHLIAAATIPALSEFKKNWLPSSRSFAFTKKIWQQVGGYPEWIPLCEDVIFDLKIKKSGIAIEYIREALVFWRPRTSLKNYFKQLFGYTRSDGHAKLWLGRQFTRYLVYSLGIILLFLTLKTSYLFAVLLFVGMVVYMHKFWHRLAKFCQSMSLINKILGFLLLPPIIAYGDIAKMCGWPWGVYERKSGKVKLEKF